MAETNRPTILCLDDEEAALTIRKLVLESRGYQVFTETHAQDGIEIVRSQCVDLVIVDHVLGDALGTDVAGDIKRLRPSVPIILLSGVTELPSHMENIDEFVSKGDGPQPLLQAIKKVLGGQDK